MQARFDCLKLQITNAWSCARVAEGRFRYLLGRPFPTRGWLLPLYSRRIRIKLGVIALAGLRAQAKRRSN